MTGSGQDEFEFESLANSKNYKRWILSQFLPVLDGCNSAVEVGAGIGQFSEALFDRGVDLTVVEMEEAFLKRLKEEFPDANAFLGTAKEYAGSHVERFDAVISVNVLEHVEEDAAELRDWARLLNGGGMVFLLVPAFQSIYAPIDGQMGHFRRYSRQGIRDLLEGAGFDVCECRYFNFLGFFLWAVNFKWLKRMKFNPASVLVFDRFLIYLAKILDGIGLNYICGQSVVAVARKRTADCKRS